MIPRSLAPALALALLAACREQPTADNQSIPATKAPQAGGGEMLSPAPQPDVNASLEPLGELPEPEAPLRFLGRWAAEERLCGSTAWRFTETELRTPAGSVCRFDEVRRVPGGYDIDARCTAEAPERDDLLRIRFAESARAMLFESASIADAGLVHCGD